MINLSKRRMSKCCNYVHQFYFNLCAIWIRLITRDFHSNEGIRSFHTSTGIVRYIALTPMFMRLPEICD